MVQLALQNPRILPDPLPGALITELADNGVQLELGAWVADPERGTGGVRSALYLALLKHCRENGIEIPFPQREVRILQSKESAASQ